MKLKCSQCSAEFEAGSHGKCPGCGKPYVVPSRPLRKERDLSLPKPQSPLQTEDKKVSAASATPANAQPASKKPVGQSKTRILLRFVYVLPFAFLLPDMSKPDWDVRFEKHVAELVSQAQGGDKGAATQLTEYLQQVKHWRPEIAKTIPANAELPTGEKTDVPQGYKMVVRLTYVKWGAFLVLGYTFLLANLASRGGSRSGTPAATKSTQETQGGTSMSEPGISKSENEGGNMKLATLVLTALLALTQACSRDKKEPAKHTTQREEVRQHSMPPVTSKQPAEPDNAMIHNLARQKSAEMTKENAERAERFGPVTRQENMAIRLSALPTLQASGEVVGSIISLASNTTIAAYSYRPIKVVAGKSGGIDDCFVVCQGSCWVPALPEVGGNDAASTPPTIAEICVPESKVGFYFRADRSADTNAQLVFYSDGFNIQPVFGGLGSKHTFKETVLK